MNTDLDYAVKQLRGISLQNLNHAGQYAAADRIQRALDALERMQEAELELPPVDDGEPTEEITDEDREWMRQWAVDNTPGWE